jgi:hypothetical protein
MDDCPHLPPPRREDDAPAAASPKPEARRAELRAAVKRELEDIEQGRVADLESALDRIEALLDELETTRPS